MSEKKAMKKTDLKEENPQPEEEVMDDFGLVDVPDIPLPAAEAVEADTVIHDECDAAFKWCFVGAGQAGARMAEAFWKLGYRRVCIINTTAQDLSRIQIPAENKLVMRIGEGGAGKDPEKGKSAVEQYREDVYDLMRRCFGTDFDRIMVCFGAGGGTGTGCMEALVQISHDIAQTLKVEERDGRPVVGVLASMPMVGEGQRVNANAFEAMGKLGEMVGKNDGKLANRQVSPLIIVDNERISKIYPGLPVAQFWSVANQSISGLFHLFNSIATKDSEFTTFDQADYKDVLQSGVVTFGATLIDKYADPTDISYAIRDNLKHNVLVGGVNLKKGQKAACVFVAHPKVLEEVPQAHLEHGFEMLSRMMQRNSTVHRGIYKGKVVNVAGAPSLRVYTILGELGMPRERITEIQKIGLG
jgi:cell division GTPase FtsZ